MAPDWRAAMLPSELSSHVYRICGSSGKYPQVLQKVNAKDTKWGTCRASSGEPQSCCSSGRSTIHLMSTGVGDGQLSHWHTMVGPQHHNELTQAHTNSDESIGGKWLAPRNVGKTVERRAFSWGIRNIRRSDPRWDLSGGMEWMKNLVLGVTLKTAKHICLAAWFLLMCLASTIYGWPNDVPHNRGATLPAWTDEAPAMWWLLTWDSKKQTWNTHKIENNWQ